MKELLIKASDNVKEFYENCSYKYEGDCGIDLFTPEDVTFIPGETKFVSMDIKCCMIDLVQDELVSYYLYPRSSISKTPLRLANSVGIIDSEYRGNITVALTYMHDSKTILCKTEDELHRYSYTLKKGVRLVQICSPNLDMILTKLVDELDTNTERGDKGFGSSGM